MSNAPEKTTQASSIADEDDPIIFPGDEPTEPQSSTLAARDELSRTVEKLLSLAKFQSRGLYSAIVALENIKEDLRHYDIPRIYASKESLRDAFKQQNKCHQSWAALIDKFNAAEYPIIGELKGTKEPEIEEEEGEAVEDIKAPDGNRTVRSPIRGAYERSWKRPSPRISRVTRSFEKQLRVGAGITEAGLKGKYQCEICDCQHSGAPEAVTLGNGN